MSKKLFICFTGEPRSIKKGLEYRKIFLEESFFSEYEIETRYLICFLNNFETKYKSRIFNSIKYLVQDNNLSNLQIDKRRIYNLSEHILRQKYDLLRDLKKDYKNLSNAIILLTRTDWCFTTQCIKMINLAIQNGKVITPYLTESYNFYCKKKYKPVFDQFAVIPGNLIDSFIESLKIALDLSRDQRNKIISKKDYSGSYVQNKYGLLAPESLLGIGFQLSQLTLNHKIDNNFKFKFNPDIYGNNNHNLIRDDAHLWMNISFINLYKRNLKAKLAKLFFKIKGLISNVKI